MNSSAVRRGDWIRCYRPRPAAARRLVCFPAAGGGASFFRPWADELPADVELWAVQYPGREDRIAEPGVADMHTLADAVAEALGSTLDQPVTVFGHSMGASVGYEVTRRLQARRTGAVERLVVSARPGPRDQGPPSDPVHLRDDDGLVAELDVLGGTGAAVLDHPELRSMLLPAIRDDFRLIETYRPAPAEPLDVAIVALTGDADPRMSVARAGSWAEAAGRGFRLAVFGGGHFYLVPQRRAVVAEVLRALTTEEHSVESHHTDQEHSVESHDTYQEDTVDSHGELTVEGVRAAVAQLLDVEPASIGADDNLLALGIDSIKMMMLASQWQRYRVEVPFVELAEAPTLTSWARLLRDAARPCSG